MQYTYEALNILFLLIPGFISEKILDVLVTRKKADQFSKLIEALIFSFLIYAFTAIVYKWQPLVQIDYSGQNINYDLSTDNDIIIITLLFSIILPFILSGLIHNDLHTKFFRFLRITDKTSRISVWQDVFLNEKKNLVITLNDNKRIFGWPMYYSHEKENSHIYLFNPAWIDDDCKYIECNTHGILIKNEDIRFIEFTNPPDDSSYLEKEGKGNEQKRCTETKSS